MKVKFARKQFHNSLHDFAAKQIETFKKAVDDVSVGEACEMRRNLLELCLIFTTVFVLYKQEVETVNILESDERESWNRLVQLQEDQFAGGLATGGVHLAVLGVLPQMSAGKIQMPTVREITLAFREKSKVHHTDKINQVDRSRLRSVSHQQATANQQAINEARDFLLSKNKDARKEFLDVMMQLFRREMLEIQRKCEEKVTTLLKEERYRNVKGLLDEMKQVDRQLAAEMGVNVDELWQQIEDRLKEEVRNIQATVTTLWRQGSLRDLNAELRKLLSITKELAAHESIVPGDLIEGIEKKVRQKIEELGDKARNYIARCSKLEQAVQNMMPFATTLIELGHIFSNLNDFQKKAKQAVSHALALCCEKPWGAEFLLKLGMKMGRSTTWPSEGDATVAKVILSEFPHFQDVHTVMFNKETRPTKMNVEDSLKAVCSDSFGRGCVFFLFVYFILFRYFCVFPASVGFYWLFGFCLLAF